MIGNFEIKKRDLNLSEGIINLSDYPSFENIFIVPSSTTMTATQFGTESYWINRITYGDRFYFIKNILDSQTQGDDFTLYESKQGFRYQSKKATYRFALSLNIDIEYYQRLRAINNDICSCYFSDINNNLYGVASGSNVLPFTLDFVGVQKINFGTNNLANTLLIVDFYDISELERATVIKPEWQISLLKPVWYNLVEYSGEFTRNNCPVGQVGSEVTFTVAIGSISSEISQNDAEDKAELYLNENGQDYANSNGSCSTTLIYEENFSDWSAGLPVGWVKSNVPPVISNETNRIGVLLNEYHSDVYDCIYHNISPSIEITTKIKVTVKIDEHSSPDSFCINLIDNSSFDILVPLSSGLFEQEIDIPGTIGSFTFDRISISNNLAGDVGYPHNIIIDYIQINLVP